MNLRWAAVAAALISGAAIGTAEEPSPAQIVAKRRFDPVTDHPSSRRTPAASVGYDVRGAYYGWSSRYVGARGYLPPYASYSYNAYYYRPWYTSPGPVYYYYHRPRMPAYYSGYNYYASPAVLLDSAPPAQLYVPTPAAAAYAW